MSQHPESSGRAVHDEVGGLDIGERGRRLVLRHTHMSQRRPYPLAQTGAETSDSGAKAVKPDPRCSWESRSGRVSARVGNESTESRKVVQLFRLPTVIRPMRRMNVVSDELLSRCAASTNGCLELSHPRAFALGGQVSAEWSRCRGSMARRARESVAPLRRSMVGWMSARIVRLSAGAGRRYPVTIRKESLMTGSMRRV